MKVQCAALVFLSDTEGGVCEWVFHFGASHFCPLWLALSLLWWASLNCICLSVTASRWTEGTTAAKAWRRFTTLVHTLHLFCRIGVCAFLSFFFFLWLPSTHKALHTSLFLPCVLLCSPNTVKTSALCQCIHQTISFSAIISPKHFYLDPTALPVCFVVVSSLKSVLQSSKNIIRDGKDISCHQRAELCCPPL